MKYLFRFSVFMVGIALMGFGCTGTPQLVENTVPVVVPASVPVNFDGLSPAEAAKKINFVKANVIQIHQSFTNQGDAVARQLGWGPDVTLQVVIRRFAPGYQAEIEWRRHTSIQTGLATASSTGVETREFTGAFTGGALQASHALMLPSTWVDGERDAFGAGLLWISSDVYENLVKSKMSTLTFGLFDQNAFNTVKGSSLFTDAVTKLKAESQKAVYKDPTLTVADAPTVMSLRVNGKPVNVEVIVAHNWLGDLVILHNPQNPLVLRVTMKQLPGMNLGGLFDYEVTDVTGIMQ